MNNRRRRPLSLGYLRAFEAVARTLGFGTAAAELHLTQSAISRQIKQLEDELGAPLFVRGTRHVQLAPDGQALLRVVEPWLQRLDAGVQRIRQSRSRPRISITTFASFASMWLLSRIEAFQREHPDIDIRVSADDVLLDLDEPELDLALRCCLRPPPGATALALFGETLTPVVSRSLLERIEAGSAPPLAAPADLARHTLIDDEHCPVDYPTWRHWFEQKRQGEPQPARWLYLDFTYQQIQAALAGQGVALARVPLIYEALQRGDLIEPFGPEWRSSSRHGYWMVLSPAGETRPEVRAFADWLEAQAALTRAAIEATAAAPVLVAAG
jgi:LysR family glycine cleavage system transcriptional activator